MTSKIYFAGSIRGGRQDVELYRQLIEEINKYGNVLSEFVGDKNVTDEEGTLDKTEKEIHDQDIAMITECDYLIAEVTQTSLGVGYEIGRAFAMKKKVLCLYRPGPGRALSAMIRGPHNGTTFIVKDYNNLQEAADFLKTYLGHGN